MQALGSFMTALQVIKAEVVFRALPVPDILDTLRRECRGPAAPFFGRVLEDMEAGREDGQFWPCAQPWLETLTRQGLSAQDVRHISSALYALGRYDGAAQAEAIDGALRALEGELAAANSELGQKGRIYRAMGVTVGIMLALIVV